MSNKLIATIKTIKDDYARQLQDSLAAQNQANAVGKLPYDYNISQADKAYQPKVNQLYMGNELGRRALAERMANMGLGVAGGASQRAGANLSNSFLKGVTGVGLEKQNYIDEQTNTKTNLDAQNQARLADITAQNAAGRNAAVQQQKNLIAQQFLSMYLAKRISKKKYNEYMKELNKA